MDGWSLRHAYAFSGGQVRFDVFGHGEPLVLVHGTPFSSYAWRRILPELSRRWTVHLYDLLGYGASEKRAGQDVSLGIQNRVLAELLDHWGLEAPAVVGHDFGGATVLRTNLVDGRGFSRMALLDPVAVAPWGSPFVRHVRRHEEAFAGVPAYIHRAIIAAYVRGAAHRPMSDDDLAPLLAPWLGEDGQPAFYRQIAQMDQRYTDEVEPRYREVGCPVLIIWGEDDGWIPVSQGRRLHELIPHARLEVIPGAGHLVQDDAPEIVTRHLLRFLSDS